MSYQCVVPGCPANHVSKHEICTVSSNLKTIRDRIAAIDPYPGVGGRDCGLGMADSHREVVQAFKDRVLDILDEITPDETTGYSQAYADQMRTALLRIQGIALEPGQMHNRETQIGNIGALASDALIGSPLEPAREHLHWCAIRIGKVCNCRAEKASEPSSLTDCPWQIDPKTF